MTRLQTIETAEAAFAAARMLPEGSDEREAAWENALHMYDRAPQLVYESSPRRQEWN